VAIHLSPDADNAVREARDALRERLQGLPIKWVSDSNLHLTLRFLGHVRENSLKRIAQQLAACAGSTRFQLQTGRLGAFPTDRAARVIWIGLGGETNQLVSLQQCVERAVSGLVPHEENKPFNAHLTIARCELRAPDREWVRRAIAETSLREVTWPVTSFELMKSSLNPKGARYSELARYELQ